MPVLCRWEPSTSRRDSWIDVERLDDVPREIEVGSGRLRVREDRRDEPGTIDIEDVQVPAVGRALSVEAGPGEHERMATWIRRVVLIALGERIIRQLELHLFAGVTVDRHRRRV